MRTKRKRGKGMSKTMHRFAAWLFAAIVALVVAPSMAFAADDAAPWTEWADNDTLGGRADIVAFRWNHMEHRKRILQLTLIEVKQGDGAIETYETKNKKGELMLSAGLCKHYEDYLRFKENKDYVKDVAKDMLIYSSRMIHEHQ